MAVVALSLACSPGLGYVEFKDGQVHDIDYEIEDDVRVDYLVLWIQTTVNLLEGGRIGYPFSLEAYEHSRVNILGGSVGRDLWAWDSSQIRIVAGSIDYDVRAYETSQVQMSSGAIRGGLAVHMSSRAEIAGGSIGDVLVSTDQAIVTIHGSDFAVDGEPFGYGELTSLLGGWWEDEPRRHLSGTLDDGEPLDNGFYVGYDAKIVLVPEPATILLMAFGGLALLRTRLVAVERSL